MPETSGIAERIRLLRRIAGLSQAEFAELLGVNQRKISRIETGTTDTDPQLLVAIREKTNVSLDWLLTGKGSQPGAAAVRPQPNAAGPGEVLSAIRELRGAFQPAGAVAEGIPPFRAGAAIPVFEIEGQAEMTWDGGLPSGPAAESIQPPPGFSDPAAFACRLRGDSMQPDFRDGDILIFSPSAEVRSGDFACVRFAGRSTFRQVFWEADAARLAPANRRYPEQRLDRQNVLAVCRLAWRLCSY